MNNRLLLVVALLALALAGFLWFTSGEGGPQERGPSSPARAGSEPPREEQAPADLAEPPPGEPASLTAPAVADDAQGRREQAEREDPPGRTWDESETVWLDVLVTLPPGAPADEQVRVLALDEPGDYEDVYGERGPVTALLAGKDPGKVPDLVAVADATPDGAVRLALPPDAEHVWLAVSGLYVYSLETRAVHTGEVSAPVELRPLLGARVSGRLVAPGGTPKAAVAGVEVQLDWAINARLQLGAAESLDLGLAVETDDEGRFDFRAVPVGKPQTLEVRPEALAHAWTEDLAPRAGEHLRVDVALAAGGTVLGRVVDANGAPIAAAGVTALGREFFGNPSDDLRGTETDADGRFELARLTPGKVWLRVRHDEYQTLLDEPFQLADGERRDRGDVVLDEGLAISGTVAFPDGTPATGASVSVAPDLSENLAGTAVDPRAFIGNGNTSTADERGAFRVIGLGSGPWTVSVQLDVGEGEDAGGRVPGLWTARQGVVRAPAEDLALTLEAPVVASGVVLDTRDAPVGAFRVHAELAGSQWYMPPSETKDGDFESEDGTFVLEGLRAGKWTFSAEAEGYARSTEVELTLPTEERLALVLERPILLGGRVVDPDGNPVAGAEVSKELEGAEMFEAMQGRSDWPVARSGEDGAFRLEGMPPGIGSIVARKDGYAPSAAVPVELGEGEQDLEMVLVLRKGGTISGEVYGEDGKPAARSLVILQIPTMQERRMTSTDAQGEFREEGLTPATWQVQAFPGVESLQGENGEALDQAKLLAALKMTTVELADREEEHVVLGAPPAAPVRVHGRVTLDGEPVPGALLSFVPGGGGGLERLKIATLDDDGRYELRLDEPGEYLVTVQRVDTPGRQNSIEFRRTVPEAEEARFDFALPLGRVSGRVTDSGGDPVAGARVTLTMQDGLVFGTVFGGQYSETVTDASGEYVVEFLRPGRYTVAAGGAPLGGLFGNDASLGREVRPVEVAEDQWVRGVDFRLEEPGRIHGTVRDAAGKPVPEASIFLRDEDGRLLELFSLAQTNATGGFEYPGLAPGEYTLTARTRTLSSGADAPVRVRAGETAEVTVTLEPGTVLLVTLEDRSGADIRSRVSVVDERGREMNGMIGLSEIMQRYAGGLDDEVQRVGPLPPGTYEVRAFAADGRDTSRSVTLSGQPERKLKLRLR